MAGEHVVAWVQGGHTCVLASRSAPTATLLGLAIAEESATTVAARGGYTPPV